MSGFPNEWVAKYGQEALKPINLIHRARELNTILLSGAIIFAYYLLLQFGGVIFATIFSIFYGYNHLVIDEALHAHSEALFLFTFNAALLFESFYFTKERRLFYLLLFSVFTGLCMSTKLNGIMLAGVFFIANTMLLTFLKKERVKHFLFGFLPILISLIIFIVINPFTYSDPVKNVQYMFNSRMKTAVNQAEVLHESYIPPGVARIKKIFANFYFSRQTQYYNSNKIFKKFVHVKNDGVYLFILFILGLFHLLRQTLKKNITAIIVLISFLLILGFTICYLILDWARYYIHLVLFFSIFQYLGLFFLIQFIYKYTKLFAKRVINHARKK